MSILLYIICEAILLALFLIMSTKSRQAGASGVHEPVVELSSTDLKSFCNNYLFVVVSFHDE